MRRVLLTLALVVMAVCGIASVPHQVRHPAVRPKAKPPASVIAFKLGPAASDPLDTPLVWLHIEWADVRDVVRKLLPPKTRLSMDANVTGTVSLLLHRGTVGQALYQVLQQVGAIYETESGVVSVRSIEAWDKTSGEPGDPLQERFVTLSGNHLDVRETLQKVFEACEVSYSIAPEVQGEVTFDFHHATLAQALQTLLRQVDATYRVEAGVFQIVMPEG